MSWCPSGVRELVHNNNNNNNNACGARGVYLGLLTILDPGPLLSMCTNRETGDKNALQARRGHMYNSHKRALVNILFVCARVRVRAYITRTACDCAREYVVIVVGVVIGGGGVVVGGVYIMCKQQYLTR